MKIERNETATPIESSPTGCCLLDIPWGWLIALLQLFGLCQSEEAPPLDNRVSQPESVNDLSPSPQQIVIQSRDFSEIDLREHFSDQELTPQERKKLETNITRAKDFLILKWEFTITYTSIADLTFQTGVIGSPILNSCFFLTSMGQNLLENKGELISQLNALSEENLFKVLEFVDIDNRRVISHFSESELQTILPNSFKEEEDIVQVITPRTAARLHSQRSIRSKRKQNSMHTLPTVSLFKHPGKKYTDALNGLSGKWDQDTLPKYLDKHKQFKEEVSEKNLKDNGSFFRNTLRLNEAEARQFVTTWRAVSNCLESDVEFEITIDPKTYTYQLTLNPTEDNPLTRDLFEDPTRSLAVETLRGLDDKEVLRASIKVCSPQFILDLAEIEGEFREFFDEEQLQVFKEVQSEYQKKRPSNPLVQPVKNLASQFPDIAKGLCRTWNRESLSEYLEGHKEFKTEVMEATKLPPIQNFSFYSSILGIHKQTIHVPFVLAWKTISNCLESDVEFDLTIEPETYEYQLKLKPTESHPLTLALFQDPTLKLAKETLMTIDNDKVLKASIAKCKPDFMLDMIKYESDLRAFFAKQKPKIFVELLTKYSEEALKKVFDSELIDGIYNQELHGPILKVLIEARESSDEEEEI